MNTLTGQIAKLNTQISDLQGLGQDASPFMDQRDVLIGQLSNLVDVSAIQSDNGLTLTTAQRNRAGRRRSEFCSQHSNQRNRACRTFFPRAKTLPRSSPPANWRGRPSARSNDPRLALAVWTPWPPDSPTA